MSAENTHRFRISDPAAQARAAKLIENLDLSKHWQFELTPYKRNRSLEANALFHKWLSIVAKELGYDMQDLKDEVKRRWVVPILERDDKDFQEQLASLRELYQAGHKEKAMKLAELTKRRVSTTWLNTSQFSEMMNGLEGFASGFGIVLPQPDPEPDKQPPTTRTK